MDRFTQIGKVLIGAFLIASALSACSNDDQGPEKKGGSTPSKIENLNALFKSSSIQIASMDGTPIPNAQVLIGDAQNSPFQNNFVTAGADGTFVMPAGWTSALDVTISAPGYVRATFMQQLPQSQIFQLRAAEDKTQSYELSGTTTGFHVVDYDDTVDFSFSMPPLSKYDVFNFSVGMVISPLDDTISIYGKQVQIPSNVVLPRQKETYFLPVTLEKSNYRMFFSTPEDKQIYTARGQFPFKKVLGQFQDNVPFIQLINNFKILSGSLKTVTLTGAQTHADLPANEMVFDKPLNFTAPQFDGDNDTIIAVALSDSNGKFLPTDVKQLTPGQSVNLATISTSAPKLLSVLTTKTKDNKTNPTALSIALIDFQDKASVSHLDLVAAPTSQDMTQVQFTKPTDAKGLNPSGTYVVLSQVDTQREDDDNSHKTVTPLWDVYAKSWVDGVKLPTWPQASSEATTTTHRWDVIYIGAEGNDTTQAGPDLLKNASHITRNSQEF